MKDKLCEYWNQLFMNVNHKKVLEFCSHLKWLDQINYAVKSGKNWIRIAEKNKNINYHVKKPTYWLTTFTVWKNICNAILNIGNRNDQAE